MHEYGYYSLYHFMARKTCLIMEQNNPAVDLNFKSINEGTNPWQVLFIIRVRNIKIINVKQYYPYEY